MKKVLLVSSLAVVATAAQAIDMPTISGRLNNEVRYNMQSDKSGEPAEGVDSFTAISGVANAPSYLKAAGNIPINEMLNLDYMAEIGIRIEKNNNNETGKTVSSGVDLRQNAVVLNSQFGHLVLGHTYTPSSAISSFDPFGATGAGFGGSDMAGIVAEYDHDGNRATVDGLGYRHSLRQDIIGYKSPKMMGLQLFVSQDRSNDETVDNNVAQRYDTALNFDQKFGDVGVKAMANYVIRHGKAANDENQMTGAVKVSWMGFDFSGAYTLTTFEEGGKDVDKTQMFAAAAYTMNAHKLSLGYAMREYDDKAADEKYEGSQMSLGYEYAFNANVAGTFTGSMLTLEDKTSGSTTKDNDATVLTTGLRVTF